jgi:hypothetical protein
MHIVNENPKLHKMCEMFHQKRWLKISMMNPSIIMKALARRSMFSSCESLRQVRRDLEFGYVTYIINACAGA